MYYVYITTLLYVARIDSTLYFITPCAHTVIALVLLCTYIIYTCILCHFLAQLTDDCGCTVTETSVSEVSMTIYCVMELRLDLCVDIKRKERERKRERERETETYLQMTHKICAKGTFTFRYQTS